MSDDQGWDDWDTDHGAASPKEGLEIEQEEGEEETEEVREEGGQQEQIVELSRQPHMIHGQLQLEQNLSDFKKALNQATNRELDKIVSKAHVKIEPKTKVPVPDPEPDFFADMEPVIKTNVVQLEEVFEPDPETKSVITAQAATDLVRLAKEKGKGEGEEKKEIEANNTLIREDVESKVDLEARKSSPTAAGSSRLAVAHVEDVDGGAFDNDDDDNAVGGGWGDDDDFTFDDPTSGTEDLALED